MFRISVFRVSHPESCLDQYSMFRISIACFWDLGRFEVEVHLRLHVRGGVSNLYSKRWSVKFI